MSERKPSPRRRKASSAPTTPDPIEIAMEAEADDTSPDSPARRLLIDQGHLVRWQVANERAAFVLRMLTATAGLVTAAVVAVFVWSASQAHGLVVDPFASPPSLAADGVTGEVAATRLLDRLRDLESRSVTQRDQASFANSWGGDLKVDIPKAGVSLDQVQRYLRATLGRETHITGEISRAADGLTVTVRAGDAAGATFSGRADDLDRLLELAANDIYRRTQPYRWGILMIDSEHYAEAEATYRQLLTQGSPQDRAWAYNGYGITLSWAGRPREALAVLQRARAADPSNGQVLFNVNTAMQRLGGEGEAYKARLAAIPLYMDRDAHGLSKATRLGTRLMMEGQNLQARGDFTAARLRFEGATAAPQFRQSLLVRGYDAAATVGLHQPALAHRLVGELELPPLTNGIRRQAWYEARRAAILADVEAADWPRAAADIAEARRYATGYPDLQRRDLSFLTPMQALVEARQGDLAAARATLAPTEADCDLCQRVRGVIAALAGDMAGARRAFAAARALAPMLPAADLEEGRVFLDRGDPAQAIPRFAAANRLAPRFADPLAYWGEALLAQGDAKGAAAKFDAASKLAPRWGRLHLKWGEALAKLAKADEAQAKWRAASGMDLSAADRARLTTLLAGRPA